MKPRNLDEICLHDDVYGYGGLFESSVTAAAMNVGLRCTTMELLFVRYAHFPKDLEHVSISL